MIPVLLVFSGCLTSPEPFYQQSDLIVDDRITGTYHLTDDSGPVEIIKGKDPYNSGQYFVSINNGATNEAKLDATLFQIGTNRFLDVVPELESLNQPAANQFPAVGFIQMFMLQPLHLLVKVDFGTNDVRFGVVDMKEIYKLSKKFPEFFQGEGDSLRVIADTQMQRKFLLRFGSETNLFTPYGSRAP